MRPDLVCSCRLWRFYEGTLYSIQPVAPARAPIGSAGKHMSCALRAPRWSCPLLTRHHEAGARHTMPLRDLPGATDVMRHAPPLTVTAAPRPAGSHRCTRAAAHRWDTAPDGRPPAAHTPSASPARLAPPAAAGQAPHDRQPGLQRGWDGTARTTARPASVARGH